MAKARLVCLYKKETEYKIQKSVVGADLETEYKIQKSVVGADLAEYKIQKSVVGADLVGLKYEPLFDYFMELKGETSFRVLSDNYVTSDSGTGI
ncbi:hypothetical protein T484DRAFT_1774574, partial [Baffinella frigidus]